MKIRLPTFFLIILAILIAVMIPFLKKAQKSALKSEAINDLKQIAISLNEIHLQFPDSDNQKENIEQFLPEELTSLQHISYSLAFPGEEIPSSLVKPFEREYQFSFITLENGTGAKPDRSHLPLVVTHLIPGTQQFDRGVFAGEAVDLRHDFSIHSCTINQNGKAYSDDRENTELFDISPYIPWRDWEPVVHHEPNWKPAPWKPLDIRAPLTIAYLIEAAIIAYLLFRAFLTIRHRNAS